MIDFQKITPADREKYLPLLMAHSNRGCEYSFANLNIWGRQRACLFGDFLVFFSQFERVSIYPFPLGQGDVRPVLDALIEDARKRGIPCRLSSMTSEECALVDSLYPGMFHFHTDRDNYDYVYNIEDLAFLRGKRYQSKRNFANRFWNAHPNCQTLPLDGTTQAKTQEMLHTWFAQRQQTDPLSDFYLEKLALERAFAHRQDLGLEGLVLMEEGQVLAMTMGSRLSETTFDIHFEKALDGIDGAYAAINNSFSKQLLEKYPTLQHLNREDDLGIEGLRKAKLSYHPAFLVEKYWARLWEDEDAH